MQADEALGGWTALGRERETHGFTEMRVMLYWSAEGLHMRTLILIALTLPLTGCLMEVLTTTAIQGELASQ